MEGVLNGMVDRMLHQIELSLELPIRTECLDGIKFYDADDVETVFDDIRYYIKKYHADMRHESVLREYAK